jgi:Lrp/AsnC family transcriptional regulator, regulator for asnA, asnC and gidA
MELKESDKKLLACLDYVDRAPMTKIAKITGLSRKQVEYKINKYLKEGLIEKFDTLFDYSKLGYTCYIILLVKFGKFNSIDKFSMELNKDKNCISWGKIMGEYDLYINLIFRDELEMNEYLTKLIGMEEELVSDYLVVKPSFFEKYPRKFLWNKINKEKNIKVVGYNSKKVNLDEIEIKILKILEKNGRTRLIDIAKKLNITSELAFYKIKRLYNEKVILGTRLIPNMEKLGFYFTGILLQVRNLSEKNKEKLKDFAKKNPYVDTIMFSIARPNCYIQLFHKTELELRNTIIELKNKLRDEPFDLKIIMIHGESEINRLPFL